MRPLFHPARATVALLAMFASFVLLPRIATAEPAAATSAPGISSASAFTTPVDATALASMRGGSDLTHNDLRLDGVTAGNSAANVVTGTNTIATGAFAGMSGLPLVVQNSGANVLIQNAVIVNVKME